MAKSSPPSATSPPSAAERAHTTATNPPPVIGPRSEKEGLHPPPFTGEGDRRRRWRGRPPHRASSASLGGAPPSSPHITSGPHPRSRAMSESPDNAGVRIFPPALFIGGLVIGYVLDLIRHVPIAPPEWSLAVRILGGVAALAGIALGIAALGL